MRTGGGYERNVGEHRTERVSEPWNRNMICKRVSERKRLYEREREIKHRERKKHRQTGE